MATVEYLNYEVLDDHDWTIDDEDLFEKAESTGLNDADYGTFEVSEGDFILETAENEGMAWPFSCRVGGCANCAVILKGGEVDVDMQMILTEEEIEEQDIRLSCVASPATDHVQVIYNAKHLDYLLNRVI